ncbi:uncharacterized protein LOC130589572 [Beta vulgaris subsp. vulgaris]|uniref:uncharacterized protein LOC130589572 n=1 Tax=Beta vulgaris subsp. vulgaris TaxID=3555 RepID=UPI002547CD45|nr:uncharacterized protein LOC130589572 [Beta vulgaris subsp. vulgaris]
MSGEELWSCVKDLPKATDGLEALNTLKKLKKGWFKQSCLWELPYWKSLHLRNNLDVMHIEKNFFDQLIHTIMDVKKQTSDTVASRKDIAKLCKRPQLHVTKDANGKETPPKAPFALDIAQRKVLCNWVRDLKFPDGYASDLTRCVDMQSGKLHSMKSHDCHVFMERLLPIALKELLPVHVWKAVTEISLFFRDLCCSTITVRDMERLEKNIAEIICKLEKIFPPSFFNSMEHLPVHLPREARLCGPVQYRWMYPFERFLNHLKRKIGNKARVETYNKKLDDCSTQGSQPNPDLLYWETVGGRNRGKVQGLGQGDYLYYNSSSGRGEDGSSQPYEPSIFSQLEAQVEAKVAARMVEVEAKVAARLEESNRALVQEMMRNMTNFGHLFSGCNTGPSPQRRPEDDPGFGGGGTTQTPTTV